MLLSLHVFLGRVPGDAEIAPGKNRGSFPLSANVFWCWLRILLWAEYWGVHKYSFTKNAGVFLLSKNVCWCWLRMLLLAEYVPATMLDPKSLGTAFQKKKVRVEFHILTFIEQCSGLQGRRRCLAAGVLDIWHGTDPPDLGTARHGTSLA